jgi:hypothetical protein
MATTRLRGSVFSREARSSRQALSTLLRRARFAREAHEVARGPGLGGRAGLREGLAGAWDGLRRGGDGRRHVGLAQLDPVALHHVVVAVGDLGGGRVLLDADHPQGPQDVAARGHRGIHDLEDRELVARRDAVLASQVDEDELLRPRDERVVVDVHDEALDLAAGRGQAVRRGPPRDERDVHLHEGLQVVPGVDVLAGLLHDGGGGVLGDEQDPQPALDLHLGAQLVARLGCFTT